MIARLQLIRNIGVFDSVDSGAVIDLNRYILVYAENGRGKTTLTAILRSLSSGDALSINERRRLAAQHPPHVVLDCSGGPPPAMFQNGQWNRTLPNIIIFDDCFVDNNVYSGLTVEAEHRQNLHHLILGSRGVALNQRLQEYVRQIEIHNTNLRMRAAAIPAAERGQLSVDDFCALPPRADVDEAIQLAERNLAAARDQQSVRITLGFSRITLPSFDVDALAQILGRGVPELDTAAAALVQAHFGELGPDGEAWVENGMRRVERREGAHEGCPFCAQNLAGSPVISHYRAYFSAEYAQLRDSISAAVREIDHTHGGEAFAGFERNVRILSELRQFWSRFCDVPVIDLDTAAITRNWQAARHAVSGALEAKRRAPLEPIELGRDFLAAIEAFHDDRRRVLGLDQRLQQANAQIQIVKEQAATADPQLIETNLVRLRAIRARHQPRTAALCADFLTARAEKEQTENLRDETRAALEHYRTNVFPGYQTAINLYLQRFNAGYRLEDVRFADTRGGPTCNYNVLINNSRVAVAGGVAAPGEHSFRNTLSSGDRNTLALAFFFASLDQDPRLADKIIVVDDPISSLDEHRSLTTVQQLRDLGQRVRQLIILSHKRPFLCRMWEGIDPTLRTALFIGRDGSGSTITTWNVDDESASEHDRRHALLREYLAHGLGIDNRKVAESIRLVLESFLRVAYPANFPAGTRAGQFQHLCEQRLGSPQEILTREDTLELRHLLEYANRFHHDTNPAWETEIVNDGELREFVERTLRFTKR